MKFKIQLLGFLLFFSIQNIQAQVTKKILVEHFSNTNCSVCANRNPSFYTNFNTQSDALHLAIHPSSPYANCLLSQQSSPENDERTNFYGIYGSTPRLVINGVVISGNANYASSAIFTPYIGQTSPASIRIVQEKFGTDSIVSLIIVKTEATHNLGNLSLFVALAEDTVFYTGGNGEPEHYDVFRDALTDALGAPCTLPAMVGDSVVVRVSSPADPIWNIDRIYTVAVLQETGNKALVQAEATAPSDNGSTTGVASPPAFEVDIFPNPAENSVYVRLKDVSPSEITLTNLLGVTVLQQSDDTQAITLDIAHLPKGLYWLQVATSTGALTKAIVKQ
jgi:hypothetical protein